MAIAHERFYESSRRIWLDQLAQDLRYASRSLRHSPETLITTVLTLAVGLGLLTVAFTIFNAYFLRPFAVRDPGSLHQLVWHTRDSGGQGFRWRDYDELRGRTDLFAAVIGEYTHFVSSNGRPLAEAVVSANYFESLGPAMALGRGLASVDATSIGDPVVLGHQAWIRLFDRDPEVLGRTIDLNGRAFTVIGVLGPPFTGLGDSPRDVFVLRSNPSAAPARPGGGELREVEITVRVRPDVGVAQAETALTPFFRRTIDRPDDVRAEVRPASSPNPLSLEMIAVLSPAFAAFGLVLVTCCANVSNVMLARAIAREREIAVRLSIGAGRGRLVRQLLTEGLLIALLAGAIGLALAAWGLRAAQLALVSTLPASVAPLVRLAPMPFDARVFAFALAASVATTLTFALLPALEASRMSLTDALRGPGGTPRRGSRARNALVVGQVAVAVVLVVLAVTLARSGAAVGAIDLGFDTDGVMSVNVRGEQDDLARPLADALAADPRVSEVAVTSGNPLFNNMATVAAAAAGTLATTHTPTTFVSPEFFSILRIPILRGRAFRPDEARSAARVAIVSAATAKAFWPGADPIGKTIRIERADGRPVDELLDYPEVTVVGTVGDIVTGMMIAGRDAGHIYLPMTSANAHATAILIRGRADRRLGAEATQEMFRRVAPDPQIFEVLPLADMRTVQMYPLWAASSVGALLGVVALVLSVSGLYGVLTYTVSRRTREIGIRMALGATARAVVRLVLEQSARLAGVGALVGVVVTFVAMKLLATVIRFTTISLVDVAAFAAGVTLIGAATILAAYRPARRAAGVDPAQTLRCDM